jgi:uncharacterized membrane protein YkvA (DUF1232 family)
MGEPVEMCTRGPDGAKAKSSDWEKLREVSATGHLEPDVRRLVVAFVENAAQEMGEEEFFYVGRQFERKATAVSESRIPWVQHLSAEMTHLYSIYKAHSEGEMQLTEEVVSLIGSTLYYFVNPHDIIPDHIPGRGYLDDAFVFNRCVKTLRKVAPDLVE